MDDVEVDDDEEEIVDDDEDGDVGIDPREREEAERIMREQDKSREHRRRDLFRFA